MRINVVFDFAEDDEPEAMWPHRLDWFRARIGRAMHGSDVIVGSPRPLPDSVLDRTGLYFLIREERIFYVGQSCGIYSRIAAHVKKGLRIDRVAVLAGIPKWAQSEFEHAYINAFDPAGNVERKRCGQLRDLPELTRAAESLDKTRVSRAR